MSLKTFFNSNGKVKTNLNDNRQENISLHSKQTNLNINNVNSKESFESSSKSNPNDANN